MGGISLKCEKLEDEFEVESKLYQNEGDVEMEEMCFSLGKKKCVVYYLPENLQLHSNQDSV